MLPASKECSPDGCPWIPGCTSLDVAQENSPLPEDPLKEVYDLANEFLLECRGV